MRVAGVPKSAYRAMNGDETTPERTALLDAAEELIRAEGADAWTLEELAEQAGVGLEAVQAEFGVRGRRSAMSFAGTRSGTRR